MATLYIAEFSDLQKSASSGPEQVAAAPPIVEQTVAIGGASAPCAAFSGNTRMIRVHADAICSIAFGKAPVASAANMRLAADQTEYFGVNAGDKIAVITNN